MEKLLQHFAEYISEMSGQTVIWGEDMPTRLPQYLSQQYSLKKIFIDNRCFLGVLLKEGAKFQPSVFEKHMRKILADVSQEVEGYCLIARDLPSYIRQRLVERHISFVVPGRQLYWPELGLLVQSRKNKIAPVPVAKVSPATQAVLICALVGTMPSPSTPKTLAEKLGYSTMTMSRALDEIEANKLGRVEREARERLLDFPQSRRDLWEQSLPYLRSPVRETIHLKEDHLPINLRLKAGQTALAAMSMLVPPKEPVYALGREGWKKIANKVEEIPVEDVGTCRLQLWRYDPWLFATEGRVDCFSLYLSMKDERDERIESALQEMMEEKLW
jgi:DNA-binding MarR family transcriptional regulator